VKPPTERSPKSPRWDFMGRYQVRVGGELFLDRLRVIQCPWFAVLLTRICHDDNDRDPHNHSRPFATFILSGGYAERVYPMPDHMGRGGAGPSEVREHPRFSLRIMPQRWAHQITRIDGPLRTLVIAGRHHGTWHFWTKDGPVDWKEYG
jgi:hypothetical protein